MVNGRPARAKLYEEAQTIFKKEAPWVTLAHAVVYRAMLKGVQGYKIDPFGADYFFEVDLKVVPAFDESHEAQMLTYLQITNLQLALLLNFKHRKLEWKRIVR